MNSAVIYLRWGPNRNRADAIADALGAQLVALPWQTKDWLRTPVRYAVQFLQTIFLLFRRRPRLVFSQHTQPFCSLAVLLYAKATGATLVTDCHNGPFVDRIWRCWPMGWLNRLIYARAKLNLVHNEEIRRFAVEQRKLPGRFVVLWDRIPTFPAAEQSDAAGRDYVMVIGSFSSDEPTEAMLAAARVTPDVRYRMTGNPRRLAVRLRKRIGPNVELTGYLPDEAYDRAIAGARVVVALSTREHVLMRACHEAVGAGRAFVTSDTPTVRAYLDGGTVFVRNTADAIAGGIRQALSQQAALAGQMRDVRQRRQADWERQMAEVRGLLGLTPR